MVLFITYLIKVFICSGVLYGYYALALKNDNSHQWNRYYLLLATLLSLVLPLLQIQIPFYNQPEAQTYTTQLITLREFITYGGNKEEHSLSGLWLVCYTLVGTLLLGRMLLNLRKIHMLAKTSRIDEHTGFILLENHQIQSPFSFFNNIFWNGNIKPDSKVGQQILRHELAHITGHHTTDKMLMEAICALYWINPFFHLLKRELSMVHEFIADKAAADEDTASDYARTILLLTLQSKQLPIVNNFSQAPVKRRILMLFNNKTNNTIMKKSIVLPIVVTLIAFISFQQKNHAQATSPAKKQAPANNKEVFTFVENPPTFKGGENALGEFLSKNIHYPKAAHEKGVGGTVYIRFVVESDGSVQNIKSIGQPLGYGLDEEALRVVKLMPNWEPGKHKGQLVAVEFNLPIKYSLQK
ncbi:TonB family C-terminal domain-containing protein [Chitinophaga sp. CF118]|uniref:M56 family metallopeptidase n=1 Tax=Chitinophaga sp. CF118 TaxID=1884367 RepID=UPI0008E8756B|nr:M56 family metallopeptidase [Chitinophaga sp. CF118]SFD04730.1 TonB family C-terminal domain-containing protein [Chitinophaga sp. CF118]